MALKPSIYKTSIQLADSDRHVYTDLTMTLAQHPSETLERLTARLIAYCLEYEPGLEFSRGLSTTDEPAIWHHNDNGTICQWIEMGHPEPARLKKACGISSSVKVYSYGKSTDTWWSQNQTSLSQLDKVSVFQFDSKDIEIVTAWWQRNLSLSLSISGGEIYISDGQQVHTMQAAEHQTGSKSQ